MEATIFASLNIASREEHWLILEDLHLANERFCYDLKHHLLNIQNSIGEGMILSFTDVMICNMDFNSIV